MPDDFRLQLKFWGVRGSTPTPHSEFLGYGGNTTCMEVRGRNGERIIFDAGTGIRNLGRELVAEGPQLHHLFLSHFHWDHIHGLPFFAPLLGAGNTIHFHSFPEPGAMQRLLEKQMSSPYFTLDFNAVGAKREYSSVEQTFRQGGISVTSFALNHPQGARGYRIEAEGAVIVIATDFEHGNEALDRELRDNAEGADVLVYDAQYTPAEYDKRRGWGHSNYIEAVRAGQDAHAAQVVLFHHDPAHDDQQMNCIVEQARRTFENTVPARELETITL